MPCAQHILVAQAMRNVYAVHKQLHVSPTWQATGRLLLGDPRGGGLQTLPNISAMYILLICMYIA